MSNYDTHTRQKKALLGDWWWAPLAGLLFFAPLAGLWLTRPAKVRKLARNDYRIGSGPFVIGLFGTIWLVAVNSFAPLFTAHALLIALVGGLLLSLALGRSLAARQQEPLPLTAVILGIRQSPRFAGLIGAVVLIATAFLIWNQATGRSGGMGSILCINAATTVLLLRIGDTAVRTRRVASAQRDTVAGIVAIGLGTTEEQARELLIDSRTTDGGLQTLSIRGHRAEQTKPAFAIDQKFESLDLPWRAERSSLTEIILIEMSAKEVAARAAATVGEMLLGDATDLRSEDDF